MKLSIIIPVYNSEKYLRRCVESVLAQTYKNLEIILVDDCSTDESWNICNSLRESDQRIKAFHFQKNGGVSHARNYGMERANGEYIAFVDSDDYIKDDMYEKLLQIAEHHKADVVSSDIDINGKNIACNVQPNCFYNKKRIQNEILPLFTYSGSIGTMAFTNKIFRWDAIKNIRFYEEFSYQEDLMFMINVYGNIDSFYYLPEAFYEYIPLHTGLYSSYRKDSGEKFIEARKRMLMLIKRYDIKINTVNFNNTFLYNISFYIYRTIKHKEIGKERKKLIMEILTNCVVIECCEELSKNATSFDRRIAKAIKNQNNSFALLLIKFVYSGNAKKVQGLISKLKNTRNFRDGK